MSSTDTPSVSKPSTYVASRRRIKRFPGDFRKWLAAYVCPRRREAACKWGKGWGKGCQHSLTAFLLLCSPALAQTGPARAVDGDTLDIAGQRVRIWGIDSPERSQTCEGRDGKVYECGRDASAGMAELIRGRIVTCAQRNRDRYGRIVATCATEEGDLGAAMVRRGWAVDYTQYSHGQYSAEQSAAKAEGLGIWSGRFEMPSEFRKAKR